MSYQPFPGAAAPQPAPAPAKGRRNTALLIVGIVVLVVGVIGGLALLVGAGTSAEDSVKDLGRAAPGCATTLQFKQTGTFLVFFEHTGTVEDLGCSTSGSFDRDDDTVPKQELSLVDPDGKELTIDDASGVSYDVDGFAGEQIGTVEIDDTGNYTLTVTPDDAADTDYAIAIGKDPTANESTLALVGIIALAIGVVVGVLLIVLGLRRRPVPATSAPTAGGPPWGQVGVGPTVTWPPAAPTMPPYAGPPTSFGAPSGAAPGTFDPTRPWPTTPAAPSAPPAPSAPAWPATPSASPPGDDTAAQPAPDPFSRPPGS